MAVIKLLLVDDQKLIRDGMRSLLKLSEEVEVVGDCSDGSQVLEAVQQCQPDVILLDLSMPKVNGIETLKLLKEHFEPPIQPRAKSQTQPQPKVLILTTFDDHEWLIEAIKEGALGFVLKDISLESLISAIQSVNAGNKYIQPSITDRLMTNTQGAEAMPKANLAATEPLTNRELEILRLMANGYSNKEIANILVKSEGTVKNHVSNLLSKLGVRDRTRAVLLGIEQGLLN